MLGDIDVIDIKCLNKSVEAGINDVKKNTPTDTGYLKKHWRATRIHKSNSAVEKSLENNVKYAIYVNNGHRIVRNKKTIGYVNGKFMLEKAVHVVDKSLEKEFEEEVERVNRKHDK